jgi:hypothetical protein
VNFFGVVIPLFPGAVQHEVVRCRPGILACGTIPDQRCTAGALHRIRETVSEDCWQQ